MIYLLKLNICILPFIKFPTPKPPKGDLRRSIKKNTSSKLNVIMQSQ